MRQAVFFTQFVTADVTDDGRQNELLLSGTSVTWIRSGRTSRLFLRGEITLALQPSTPFSGKCKKKTTV